MKELLKITEIKDAIVSAEINTENGAELDSIMVGILTLMDKHESFAEMIVKVARLYITKREELALICEEAKLLATVKLKT